MAELIHLPGPKYRSTTLDELWSEAETLGRVAASSSYPFKYRVTIQFDCRLGTIFAEGKHDSIAVALGIAINHAREIGAGSPDS